MPAVKSHGSFRCDGSLRSAGCAARGGREEEDRPTDRPQSRGSQSAEGRTPASPVLAARSLPGGRPAPLRSARPAAPCAPPPARLRPPAAAPRTAPPRCRAGPLAGEGGGGVSVRGSPGVCRGEGGRRERGDAPLRPESGCGVRCPVRLPGRSAGEPAVRSGESFAIASLRGWEGPKPLRAMAAGGGGRVSAGPPPRGPRGVPFEPGAEVWGPQLWRCSSPGRCERSDRAAEPGAGAARPLRAPTGGLGPCPSAAPAAARSGRPGR